MEKERLFKNVIIAVLLVVVVTLSVAFAVFSSKLTITGTTKVLSSANTWNVAFTKMTASKGGYATNETTPEIGDKTTSVSFTCELSTSADSCTLEGTIENKGKINAKYKGYTLAIADGQSTTSDTTISNEDIKVTYTAPGGWEANTTTLASSNSGQFTLKVEALEGTTFPSGEESEDYTVTLTFDFEQADPSE